MNTTALAVATLHLLIDSACPLAGQTGKEGVPYFGKTILGAVEGLSLPSPRGGYLG